jgi:hypothetical protein
MSTLTRQRRRSRTRAPTPSLRAYAFIKRFNRPVVAVLAVG